MRQKSNQEVIDCFINKRIGWKEGLKEKALKKNKQMLNPKFLQERYKERMERKMRIQASFDSSILQKSVLSQDPDF